MAAQTCHLGPVLPAVGRPEQPRVFDPGVNRVRIGQRRFEVPHPLEFPGMRRAVVPLMRAWDAIVQESVADGRPSLPAIIGTLYELPKPGAVLGGIKPLWVSGRSL